MIMKTKKKNNQIMKKSNLLIILFTFIGLSLFSQEKELFKGMLKNDAKIGHKKIALSPNIRSIANKDLSDIRILDQKENQAAFFLKETQTINVANFVEVKHNISFTKYSSNITINNSEKKIFNTLAFQVSNADVNKTSKIEGSNNNKKWFVISEKINLLLVNNSTKASNFYNIDFPSIDYKYIKIIINDSLSAPINIKNIGFFDRKVIREQDKYTTLNYTYNISQKENKTLIYIKANRAFEINKIVFNISEPELFKRNIKFYTERVIKDKIQKQNFKTLILNSNNKNIFKKLNINKKDFWIEIDNKDNQPLKIDEIKFSQKNKFLIADLKPNQEYKIIAGNKTLKKPIYDLINFKHKIATDLPILKIENEQVYFKQKSSKAEKPFYEKPWFMWISIALVSFIILGFTLSLMKQSKEM